jgi:hypothetical protein
MRPLVAALAALFALAAAACDSGRIGAVRIDPSLQSLVPGNTTLLAGADIDSLRNTAFYQRAIGVAGADGLDSLTRLTGIDPRKDVHEILTCSDGKSAVVLADGRWDNNAVQQHLAASGATRSGFRGRTLYTAGTNAVWFPRSRFAAAGPTDAVKQLIAAQDGEHGIPDAFRDKLNAVPEGSQFWLAYIGRPDALAPHAPQGSNLSNILEMVRGVNGLTLGLDLRSGLHLEAQVTCDAEDDARRVRDALRGLIGMGRLSTPGNQPDLLKVFDAIEVNRDHAAVNVSAKLPQNLVDEFLDTWLKRR